MQIPYKSKTIDRTNKRMYQFNYHANSEDYKNLGTLHREKRTVDYYPQDQKQDFSTKPQILGKDQIPQMQRSGQNYDYETGGLSYTQRKPDNLIGNELRAVREDADIYNTQLINDK